MTAFILISPPLSTRSFRDSRPVRRRGVSAREECDARRWTFRERSARLCPWTAAIALGCIEEKVNSAFRFDRNRKACRVDDEWSPKFTRKVRTAKMRVKVAAGNAACSSVEDAWPSAPAGHQRAGGTPRRILAEDSGRNMIPLTHHSTKP
jgi:hypothetical protein